MAKQVIRGKAAKAALTKKTQESLGEDVQVTSVAINTKEETPPSTPEKLKPAKEPVTDFITPPAPAKTSATAEDTEERKSSVKIEPPPAESIPKRFVCWWGGWWKPRYFWVIATVILAVVLILSVTIPFIKEIVVEEKIVEIPAEEQEISIQEILDLEKNRSLLEKENEVLKSKVSSLETEKKTLVSEMERVAGLSVVAPIPAPSSPLIWDAFQGLDLLREVYPKLVGGPYRLAIFTRVEVYSLTFWKELLPYLPDYDDSVPMEVADWITARYPTAAGVAYQDPYYTIIPIEINGEVALYSIINGELKQLQNEDATVAILKSSQ